MPFSADAAFRSEEGFHDTDIYAVRVWNSRLEADFSMATRNTVNLRTQLERIITKAGHSTKVAAQRYLMSREHHFEHVVNRGAATAETPAEAQPSCDALCDSAGVRGRQRGAARKDRTRGSHSGERGFFGSYAVSQNSPAAGGRAKIRPPWPWMAGRT